jgi:hypothetical protein
MALLKQIAMVIFLYTILALKIPQEGEKVDFQIEQTQRGPQAVQVKKQTS